jgi:small subunit ribosomal protein MRP21
VADAYQRLHNILQRNKVKRQLKLAERHEKKGEKRRRLSSERWRKQFAHEAS